VRFLKNLNGWGKSLPFSLTFSLRLLLEKTKDTALIDLLMEREKKEIIKKYQPKDMAL